MSEEEHLRALANRLYSLALERAGLSWWQWRRRRALTVEINQTLLDDFLRRVGG